jgi:hypothetical protein
MEELDFERKVLISTLVVDVIGAACWTALLARLSKLKVTMTRLAVISALMITYHSANIADTSAGYVLVLWSVE